MTPSSNFNLKWTKHQATLVSVFDSLLDKEKLTDCTISAEGQHLRAHKIILSACSPYFEELFTKNTEMHPIIILHDVKYDAIKTLVDFMYRGEVNVPQTKLRGVLDLSESLQIRGLSDSGYVDDVNMRKVSGINSPPTALDNHSSQPASSSCITSGQYEQEENGESGKGISPTVSAQEGVASDSKSNQRNKKGVTSSGFDKRTDYNECQEVITLDCDSKNQLASQKQVWPTVCNLIDGPVFSPNNCQSVSNVLQTTSAEMAVVENEQFIIPEAELPELPDERSTNLSTLHYEVSPERKAGDLKSDIEIVEDLVLDESVSVQNSSARNLQPSSEALQSQLVSVPCFTDGGNEPKEKRQLLRQWPPTVSPEEGGHVEVYSISKSVQNCRESFNQCGSYQGRSQNAFDEIITSDSESVHLPSGGLVPSTSCNSSDRPVHSLLRELLMSCTDSTIISSSCSPFAHQSEYRELQSSSGEKTVTENEQFLMPEPVSTGRISATVSSQQQEVTGETKNNMEIIEDLTLNDDDDGDDYSHGGDYHDDSSAEVDNMGANTSNGGLTNEDIAHTEDSNSQHPPFGSDYLNNTTYQRHKQHTCNVCGKSYSHRYGLMRHMRFYCGKEPQFQCHHCSYRCCRKDQLKIHMSHIHGYM